jgi:hypothetical protein
LREAKDKYGFEAALDASKEEGDVRVERYKYRTVKDEDKALILKHDKKKVNRKTDDGGTYVVVRINKFDSEENVRDKLKQVWEDYNMRNLVRQSVAFGSITETEIMNPRTKRVYHEHQEHPAILTDAFKYGVELVIASAEDNELFVNNVFARLSMLKELSQKDTKTHVICVYQILIAAYNVNEEK